MITVFQCEDSTDGIFSGIYDTWNSRLGHEQVKLEVRGEHNLELFSSYVNLKTDRDKAEKVARTLRNKLGQEDYSHLYQATLSRDPDKADSIYRVTVLGLSGAGTKNVMHNLQNPHVCRIFQLSRTIGNEAHRYLQFLRFRELKNGVLFSEIHPENFVLPLIGDHFADRFPREHFLIYDSAHGIFLAHESGKQWALVEGETPNSEGILALSETEEQFAQLFRTFCKTIAIQERKNLRLQTQFMPLKFRVYMTENNS